MLNIGRIVGRKLAGGKFSRNLLTQLLELNQIQPPFIIKAIGWINDHLEFSISTGEQKEAIFSFEKRQQESPTTFFNTRYLTIRCRGGELPDALTLHLTQKSLKRWDNLTLEKLMKGILQDPEFGTLGLPMPVSVDAFRKSRSLLDTWGEGRSYADFFAQGELERAQLDSIDFFDNCLNIQHSDLECTNVLMGGRVRSMPLVNFPWLDDIRSISSPTPREPKSKHEEEIFGMLTTDLTENDVIMGSNNKVREVLDYLHSKRPERMVFFSNTCVPIVTGEDVESVVKQYQSKFDVPLVFLTVTSQSMNNVFRNLLVHRRLEAEKKVSLCKDSVLNLVGFQKGRATSELECLMKKMGFRVNTMLLPTLNFEEIDCFPKACLNVIYPNNLWKHLYAQLLIDTRIKYISPAAPYGIEGTKQWLSEVAAALDIRTGEREAWQKHFNKLRVEWDALKKRAGKHRLAFIVREDELHFLLDPATTWGVPLLRMTEEMGFGIDILIQSIKKNAFEEKKSFIKNKVNTPEKHAFYSFYDFPSLRQKLKESKSKAVFTNHFFDWRVTEAGKSMFSLQHFEMGLDGALRTLRRLIGVCETPFYRRYAKFLRRTPFGLYSEGPQKDPIVRAENE